VHPISKIGTNTITYFNIERFDKSKLSIRFFGGYQTNKISFQLCKLKREVGEYIRIPIFDLDDAITVAKTK